MWHWAVGHYTGICRRESRVYDVIIELLENLSASRVIVMQIKLHRHLNPVEHAVCVGSGLVVVKMWIADVTRLLKLAHGRNRDRAENGNNSF